MIADSKPEFTFEETWKYIYRIFPLIDIPFGILCIILSKNWIGTLLLLPVFPLVAGVTLFISHKKKLQNPGLYIFLINGIIYFLFQLISGVNAPGWTLMINLTIGASFMFDNPRVGQFMVGIYSIFIGLFFINLGATWEYSLLITCALLAFTVLFARTFDYLKLQQKKIASFNSEITSKNIEITESINYARRIQFSILPDTEHIRRIISDFFVFYHPKDIVSGDFYWFHVIDKDEFIIVCADCTGHGVPGAMMTMICSNLLNNIVIEQKMHDPSEIFQKLDSGILKTLNQEAEGNLSRHDGMDATLIKVNMQTREIQMVGARRPVILVKEGIQMEIKGSKHSLGGISAAEKTFKTQIFSFEKGDLIYLYSDGYNDQFGGDQNKKLGNKQFKALLSEIQNIPLNEQKECVDKAFYDWKKDFEQTDDVIVIGLKLA